VTPSPDARGYRSRANVRGLRVRGIVPRVARKDIESRDHLGRHRWVAERTLAWPHHFRRPLTRYERDAEIHQTLLTPGAILICWNAIERFRRS
jgi:transposase